MPTDPKVMDALWNITQTQEHQNLRIHQKKKHIDQACFDLAESFLDYDYTPFGKAEKCELAEMIQDTIEDYMYAWKQQAGSGDYHD